MRTARVDVLNPVSAGGAGRPFLHSRCSRFSPRQRNSAEKWPVRHENVAKLRYERGRSRLHSPTRSCDTSMPRRDGQRSRDSRRAALSRPEPHPPARRSGQRQIAEDQKVAGGVARVWSECVAAGGQGRPAAAFGWVSLAPLLAPTGSYGTLAPAIMEDRSTRGLAQEGRGFSVHADGAGRAGARGAGASVPSVAARPLERTGGWLLAAAAYTSGQAAAYCTPSGALQRPGRAAAAAGCSVSAAPAPPGYLRRLPRYLSPCRSATSRARSPRSTGPAA